MRALFVCRGNRCRSPVAESIFRTLAWGIGPRGDYEARSVGVDADPGGRQISKRDVEWADVICVMEAEHEVYIRKRWPVQAVKVRVLGIPDVYEAEDEALRTQLTAVVRGLLTEEPQNGRTVAPDIRKRSPGVAGRTRGHDSTSTALIAGGLVVLAVLVVIAGHRALSRDEPDEAISSASLSPTSDPPVSPAVTAETAVTAVPSGPEIEADRPEPSAEAKSSSPAPRRPSQPGPSSARSSPGESERPPVPSAPPATATPRVPVALPPPAPAPPPPSITVDPSPAIPRGAGGGTVVTRPSGAGGAGRDGDSREDAVATDPGAIIDWVLSEHPARRP